MSRPLFQQGRLWVICLWASVLAGGLGALHATWSFAQQGAEDQAALLVPAASWNQDQRNRTLADIQSKAEVREAAWLSPAEIARETSDLLPPERWPEILSEEDAWLPWVLEVRWHDPLLHHGAIRSRAEAFRLDAQWKLVLWEDDLLMNRRRALFTSVTLGGVALALAFVLGLAALATGTPRQSHALAEASVAVILSAVSLGIMGAVAMLEGIYFNPSSWAVAGVSAFILAAVLAPMIKRPRSAAVPNAEAQAPAELVSEPEAVMPVEASGPTEISQTPQSNEEPHNASE